MIDKYSLYEQSTQSPSVHIPFFSTLYEQIQGKPAYHLREDFCGTFLLCCEWVKENPQNTAVGLDLDPEPLRYGKKNHFARLNPSQKKRVTVLQKDVLIPTSPLIDLVIACNFSFYIFKTRELLSRYFQSVRRSLNSKGIVVLEMAGGPGMTKTFKERKTVKGKQKFVYTWDQKSFDPISHDARYAIHFKLPSGQVIKNAFEYDWRLWTIPEVRELLAEAGFSKSLVFWEASHKGEGTGEYVPVDVADNDYAWIAYVVGVK